MSGEHVLILDYPPNFRNVPRYAAPHPRLDARIGAGRRRYAEALDAIARYSGDLEQIEVHATDASAPAWSNGFLPGLDGAAIYAFIRTLAPSRYIEIGSGSSTKFAARAKRDGRLGTRITSIDPNPRIEVNPLCDEIVRQPFEAVDLSLWQKVRPGDVVFLDGSHRVFMNGDVVAFFLDVLPSLPVGVLVGIHDIYLPYDYPQEIAERYYSEQYVLAAWLLGGARAEIVLPAHWVTVVMSEAVERLWAYHPHRADIEHHGAAFWIQTG